jgi:hypothetical protein
MGRRKELRNVVSGLYGSFISRNNDVGGYWGIGKLCLLAQQHDTGTVYLDLMAQSISPRCDEFTKLLAGYRAKLQKHLESRRIPSEWVASAIIEIDFKPPYPNGKHIPIVTWGNLFKLAVSITDDRGKNYAMEGYSYCGPHNPRKELKSAGGERF